jgi:hypothetical protein
MMVEGDEEASGIDISVIEPYVDHNEEAEVSPATEAVTIDAEEAVTIDAEDGSAEVDNKIERELDEIDIAELACESSSNFEPMSLDDRPNDRDVSTHR